MGSPPLLFSGSLPQTHLEACPSPVELTREPKTVSLFHKRLIDRLMLYRDARDCWFLPGYALLVGG